jgi:hypothetical protein
VQIFNRFPQVKRKVLAQVVSVSVVVVEVLVVDGRLVLRFVSGTYFVAMEVVATSVVVLLPWA